MYADLAQNVRRSSLGYGSVVTRRRRGREYFYVVSKDAATRAERYLGPADNADVRKQALRLRQAAEQAKALRTTVSALKQARIPAPSLPLGRVLEAVANAGLFDRGVVLIGTAAYQTYACIVGSYLSGAAIMTHDADLLVASFVSKEARRDMLEILKRADPTFTAQMSRDDRLPKVFRAANNLQVDILTKLGRSRKTPILMPDLGCSAEALKFMEYLAEESMEAVILYGAGVLVRVPPPLRFLVHKLLIAQERSGRFLSKKAKDLAQARELMEIFQAIDSAALEDALDEARERGPKWKKNINTSLQAISLDSKPGRLPLPITRPEKRRRRQRK